MSHVLILTSPNDCGSQPNKRAWTRAGGSPSESKNREHFQGPKTFAPAVCCVRVVFRGGSGRPRENEADQTFRQTRHGRISRAVTHQATGQHYWAHLWSIGAAQSTEVMRQRGQGNVKVLKHRGLTHTVSQTQARRLRSAKFFCASTALWA